MIATRTTPLSALFARIKAEMVSLGVWYSTPSEEAAFRTWLSAAWLDSGCTQNFAVLTQPSSQLSIEFGVRVAATGHRANVYWSDGSTNSYAPETEANTSVAHTYATGALRPIVVLGRITRFESTNADGRTAFGGRVSGLTALTYLNVQGSNTISGSITGLTALTYLNVQGSNTISGSITGLTALTYLIVTGSNTLSGSIAGLTALTVLNVQGSNTIGGSIAGLTALTYLICQGSNTLSGSITGLTALTLLTVTGSNTLSGSVSGLTALTYLNVQGSNTISGSVAGLTALTYLNVQGSNTLSGSVAGLTSLTVLIFTGSNTLSGSVAGLTLLKYLNVTGSNTLGGWGAVAASATGLCYMNHGGLTVLDAAEVNAILAGFWANRDAAKSRTERYIDIGKDTPTPNAAPTGQGLTDKAALQAYRSPNNTGPTVWTVITN